MLLPDQSALNKLATEKELLLAATTNSTGSILIQKSNILLLAFALNPTSTL